MRSLVISAILLCLVSFSEFIYAQSAETLPKSTGGALATDLNTSYIMCKSGKSVRTLRIEKKGIICKSIYTKEGVDQILGRTSKDGGCLEVITKVKQTLEGANWTCRDISQTRVSTSAD